MINRTFAGRLTPNNPIYFIYGGGDNASAKFQFSFNYRLASIDWALARRSQQTIPLLLGYTQRSLWDIVRSRVPSNDTSYLPEIPLDAFALLSTTRAEARRAAQF